jgi:hypothetical protein
LLAVAIVVATTFPAFAACMFTAEPPISDVGPGGSLSSIGGSTDSGANMSVDASADVNPDASADVNPDASADVNPDASADVSPDVSADVGPDVSADAGVDAGVSCFGATGTCNNLALCGMQTAEIYSAGSPPTPAGGAITAGVYVLASFIVYGETGDANGVWETQTLQISPPSASDAGGSIVSYPFSLVTETNFPGTQQGGGEIEVQGNELTFEQTCPSSGSQGATYAATATTLSLYYPVGGFQTEFVYALMQ